MVKKICVTIPEEMDIVIDRLCESISSKNHVKVSKSAVVTLLIEAGINTLIPSKKGEQNGH